MTKVANKKALLAKALILIAGPLFMAAHASATLLAFQNGGFEGFTGNTNGWNSAVPPGWTTTAGTPDVFDENTNFQSNTWGASSTGGDFLHGIGDQPGYTESALQVGLDGLVIGQQYEISFEQSITQNIWSETGGYWRIKFGDETQDSDVMSLPNIDAFEGWDWQTMIFTATATIQTLEVFAWSDTDNLRADVGIDSFFLGNPGENPDNPDTPQDPRDPPSNVPEPSSIMIFGLGAFMLTLLRRKAKF
jgi:PEP-CTERM motif